MIISLKTVNIFIDNTVPSSLRTGVTIISEDYIKYKVVPHNDTIKDKKVLVKYLGAFLLGDGNVSFSSEASKNARYHMPQKIDHEDYVLFQAEILANLTEVTIYKDLRQDKRDGWNNHGVLRIQTKTHPLYTTLRERFYVCGMKQISAHDLKLLDLQVAAILTMDDGTVSVDRNHVRLTICTDCYTYGDVVLLTRALHEKLAIPFNISQHRKDKVGIGYRIFARNDYARKFIDGIAEYIVPSFQYKIDYNTCTTGPYKGKRYRVMI